MKKNILFTFLILFLLTFTKAAYSTDKIAILDLDSPSVEGIQPNGPNNQRSEPFNTETVSDSTSESGNVDNGNLNTGFPAREASDGASTDGIGNDNVGERIADEETQGEERPAL